MPRFGGGGGGHFGGYNGGTHVSNGTIRGLSQGQIRQPSLPYSSNSSQVNPNSVSSVTDYRALHNNTYAQRIIGTGQYAPGNAQSYADYLQSHGGSVQSGSISTGSASANRRHIATQSGQFNTNNPQSVADYNALHSGTYSQTGASSQQFLHDQAVNRGLAKSQPTTGLYAPGNRQSYEDYKNLQQGTYAPYHFAPGKHSNNSYPHAAINNHGGNITRSYNHGSVQIIATAYYGGGGYYGYYYSAAPIPTAAYWGTDYVVKLEEKHKSHKHKPEHEEVVHVHEKIKVIAEKLHGHKCVIEEKGHHGESHHVTGHHKKHHHNETHHHHDGKKSAAR